MIDIIALQQEIDEWSKENFPDRNHLHPLLGLQEELGELAHSVLKAEQGIRGEENHRANERDAVGDIFIFLADHCNRRDIDLASVIMETWDKVKQRKWR